MNNVKCVDLIKLLKFTWEPDFCIISFAIAFFKATKIMPVIIRAFVKYIKQMLSCNIFNDACNALSAANTGSYNAIFFIQAFHIVH